MELHTTQATPAHLRYVMRITLIVLIVLLYIGTSMSFSLHRNAGRRIVSLQKNLLQIPAHRPHLEGREGFGKPKGYSDLSLRYVLDREARSGLPDISKPFTVLGIESSCDDTGVSIVRSDGTVLSSVVYSQNDVHEKFGGIVPTLAMEQHKINIEVAVEEAVKKAGIKSLDEIDAIAVTKGPGLEICLRVGLRKAQALAREWKKPFVTVHHLEAHCMMARLAGSAQPSLALPTVEADASSQEEKSGIHFESKVKFPFMVLLASGGHTSLLLCREMGEYTVLGGTYDDALGEAFDKAARQLGLRGASSGGVAIEQAAAAYKARVAANSTANNNGASAGGSGGSGSAGSKNAAERGVLKVPMRDKANCDFSYAGLKTSFRLAVQQAREQQGYDAGNQSATNAPSKENAVVTEPVTLPENVTQKLCADFQDVAFEHVEDRLRRALDFVDYKHIPVTALVVVGGVAANQELRRRLSALLSARTERLDAIHELRSSGFPYRSSPAPVSASSSVSTGSSAASAQSTAVSRSIALVFPPPSLCTDNGLMVAWTGVEKLLRGISDTVEDQEPTPRWPIGTPLSAEDKTLLGELKKRMEARHKGIMSRGGVR